MKIAIIDCGTNTFHLLLAHSLNHKINIIHKERRFVYLGEGGGKVILPTAKIRAIAALTRFKTIIDDYGVKNIQAFGTAMFRNAENAEDFVEEVKKSMRHLHHHNIR